jgi:integrase
MSSSPRSLPSCGTDRSNASGDLRDLLDPLRLEWVTSHSHTFRRTAATLMDEGGLTVREIADQLGHATVSMTQNVYFGRRQATKRAAQALHVIDEAANESMEKP